MRRPIGHFPGTLVVAQGLATGTNDQSFLVFGYGAHSAASSRHSPLTSRRRTRPTLRLLKSFTLPDSCSLSTRMVQISSDDHFAVAAPRQNQIHFCSIPKILNEPMTGHSPSSQTSLPTPLIRYDRVWTGDTRLSPPITRLTFLPNCQVLHCSVQRDGNRWYDLRSVLRRRTLEPPSTPLEWWDPSPDLLDFDSSSDSDDEYDEMDLSWLDHVATVCSCECDSLDNDKLVAVLSNDASLTIAKVDSNLAGSRIFQRVGLRRTMLTTNDTRLRCSETDLIFWTECLGFSEDGLGVIVHTLGNSTETVEIVVWDASRLIGPAPGTPLSPSRQRSTQTPLPTLEPLLRYRFPTRTRTHLSSLCTKFLPISKLLLWTTVGDLSVTAFHLDEGHLWTVGIPTRDPVPVPVSRSFARDPSSSSTPPPSPVRALIRKSRNRTVRNRNGRLARHSSSPKIVRGRGIVEQTTQEGDDPNSLLLETASTRSLSPSRRRRRGRGSPRRRRRRRQKKKKKQIVFFGDKLTDELFLVGSQSEFWQVEIRSGEARRMLVHSFRLVDFQVLENKVMKMREFV